MVWILHTDHKGSFYPIFRGLVKRTIMFSLVMHRSSAYLTVCVCCVIVLFMLADLYHPSMNGKSHLLTCCLDIHSDLTSDEQPY